jgi:hypothetical protein
MPPAKGLPAPAKTDKVAYGGYIVNSLAHCFECHSPPDAHGAPDFAHRPGGGGFEITLAPGMVVHTANITPDPETGIGKCAVAVVSTASNDRGAPAATSSTTTISDVAMGSVCSVPLKCFCCGRRVVKSCRVQSILIGPVSLIVPRCTSIT